MDELDALAWIGRKLTWGFHPGDLEEWSALGVAEVIETLVDPDGNDLEPRQDPFAEIELDPECVGVGIRAAVVSWIDHAIDGHRPLERLMEFFWSDFFAVSIRVVRPRQFMFDHMNLLGQHALGNFSELLRSVTLDPAMLDFLDGGRSTQNHPNENFARELLELYSVGIGNFTEADVIAGARALTGYEYRRRDGRLRYVPNRHDRTPQTLLGIEGVSDVDSAIDAVLSHPATAPRIVDKLASMILGPNFDRSLTTSIAESFNRDWELRPVLRQLLELGTQGHAVPSVVQPIAWYVAARRVPTFTPRPSRFREYFELSGQLIMSPPNVGGFPDPDAYFSTSATLARLNMAAHLAQRSVREEAEIDVAGLTEDIDALALRLGLVRGFEAGTEEALTSLPPGIGRLAVALAAPEMVVV